MGLKCSVFGHDYADYDVERDRANHGTEVVTTVRTTEICRRCGDARIVSENTEIAAASTVVATTTTATTAADGPRKKEGSGDGGENGESGDGRNATESASSNHASDRIEPSRERAEDHDHNYDRNAERSEGHPFRSSIDGFEFDGLVHNDHGPETSENGVGPTTAHATSRSLAESELRCRACEFVEPMLGSALRAGDSCPQCSRGYLARRTRKE